MDTFGESLRHEREARGILLEEIAAATKIGRHFLEALERNELDSLPGGAFNKGFVRAYAQFIGIDPDEAVGAYVDETDSSDGRTPESEEEMLREMSRLVDMRTEYAGGFWRSTTSRTVLLGAPLVLLAMAAWLWLGGDEPFVPEVPTVAVDATGTTPPSPQVVRGGVTPQPADRPATPEVEPPSATVSSASPASSSGDPATQAPVPDGRVSAPAIEPVVEARSDASATDPAAAAPTQPLAPVATPEPAPARAAPANQPTAANAEAGRRLTVPESGVGMAVEHRQLVGQGERFDEGDRIFFWTRVLGGRSGDAISHVWMHEGRTVLTLDLNIGAPHWRTWTRKTLYPGSAGNWTVEARDASGAVLARHPFVCVPR